MPRGRPPKPKTPKQEIANVLKWAEQQGFLNVADALRRALAGLSDGHGDEGREQ